MENNTLSEFKITLNGHECSYIAGLMSFTRSQDILLTPELDALYDRIHQEVKEFEDLKENNKNDQNQITIEGYILNIK